MSTTKLLIGLFVGCLAVVCCCTVSVVVAVVGYGEVFKTEENLKVTLETSKDPISSGESFDFIINMENTGGSTIYVDEIDINDELFDGVRILEITPTDTIQDQFSVFGINYLEYHFDPIEISPNESKSIVFELHASFEGIYRGEVTVYTDRLVNQVELPGIITIEEAMPIPGSSDN